MTLCMSSDRWKKRPAAKSRISAVVAQAIDIRKVGGAVGAGRLAEQTGTWHRVLRTRSTTKALVGPNELAPFLQAPGHLAPRPAGRARSLPWGRDALLDSLRPGFGLSHFCNLQITQNVAVFGNRRISSFDWKKENSMDQRRCRS